MITYTNNANCILDSVEVEVLEVPNPGIAIATPSGCVPFTGQFTATGDLAGDLYTWDFGNGDFSNSGPSASSTYGTPGCYDVTLTLSRAGCVATVTELSLACGLANAIADFAASSYELQSTNPNVELENLSQSSSIYTWTFGDGGTSTEVNPSYSYDETPGDYIITLIANNGDNCPDTTFRNITITENLLYFIPNTFTPDGDKFNNEFIPVFSSGYDPRTYVFQVFNRWG